MMMGTGLAFGLLIIFFSCVSSATIDKRPKLLVPDVMQSTRIVGGVAAKRGEFKGQVSLQNRYRSHVCGGTLIDERHIITAAHCYQSENIIAYAMGDDISVSRHGSNTRQLRIIENFVIHPEYNADTLHSDIAIIRVDVPFKTSSNFSAIPLSNETPKVGQKCQAVGWGTTSSESKEASVQLLKVNVEVFNKSFCNSNESYQGLLTASMFCAGDKRGQHDACKGDSGGLLTCDGKGLTGVVSFGYECGLSDYPGIYTDVSKFNVWINGTIAKRDLPAYKYALHPTTIIPTEEPTTPTTAPTTISTTVPPCKGTATTGVAPIILIIWTLLGTLLLQMEKYNCM